MGGVSMGIAGSIVDQSFFESYLDVRVETIDMSEFTRRMEAEIFDKDEFGRAMRWVKENCPEGRDYNAAQIQRSREQKDRDWETVVKMTLITRDLMIGNSRLADLGYGEEALGRNAIASGFQGQRQWTDHFPNGDFLEAILNSSFDWNGIREPFIVATENDCLNGACMLLGHLLTGTGQIFADVRTYWSPDAVKRVTGHKLSGRAEGGILHLINSGSATLDGTGRQSRGGQPVMKPFWEISRPTKCASASKRPSGTRLWSSISAAAATRPAFSPAAACPARCAASTWSPGWGRPCKLPRDTPSICRKKSIAHWRPAPTRRGQRPGLRRT
jgi:L-fucose isomerase